MAYYDVLSADSYGRFNRKLAKITNLQTAVYWSEILDIIAKVVKKKKFDDQGYFKLDRKYVEERTSISLESQLESDSILERLAVLQRHEADPNLIKVELATMEQILITDDVKQLDLPKNVVKRTATQKAADKRAAILITMKRCVSESDPDLRPMYESWVDSVYATGKNFLTKSKIQIFEDAVNSYTTDKATKVKILEAAIQSGYTEPTWVINKYNSMYSGKSKSNIPTATPQKTSTSVSTKFEF